MIQEKNYYFVFNFMIFLYVVDFLNVVNVIYQFKGFLISI